MHIYTSNKKNMWFHFVFFGVIFIGETDGKTTSVLFVGTECGNDAENLKSACHSYW